MPLWSFIKHKIFKLKPSSLITSPSTSIKKCRSSLDLVGLFGVTNQKTEQPHDSGSFLKLNSRYLVSNKKTHHDVYKKTKILIIDDDDITPILLYSILDHSEFVIEIYKLSEYLDIIYALKDVAILPDIIIIACVEDITRYFIKSIREDYNKDSLPIIITAPSKYEYSIYDLIDDGANDFIIKPFKGKELIHRIQNVLLYRKYIRKDILLNDILPANIVQSLESGSSFIAHYHRNVTILFTDICNYTVISSTWPPRKVMYMLNKMFSGFDDICLKRGIYKVETIGDAYMCASGHDGTTEHTENMILTAFSMLQFVKNELRSFDQPIEIRIGIHVGEAFSGVIGKIRPRYCFFGDTVNTASRMESHGEKGYIHVSQQVIDNLSPEFKQQLSILDLGEKEIKGKGIMKTYFVVPKRRSPDNSEKYQCYQNNDNNIRKD